MMDLSFWEPPSWEKESRISPVFWATIGVLLLGVGIGTYIFSINSQEHSLNQQLAESEATNKKLAPSISIPIPKIIIITDVLTTILFAD